MMQIISIIGLFILAALKLEQFVYGKAGKEQSTPGRVARRGAAVVGSLFLGGGYISSKKIVVRKKKADAQK
ncbi:hypothetical protein [Veillonella rodentium]|uniref:Uncharacterized protein n=1 Tax=Veillonella rodentium TaxID=248315 RepID=A0A239ZTU9_9FIRM|nr:hypothetical protein [Veillonella rodentium]SNV74096.1 Uncharacterised protein [Veillonella rodentium]